MEMPPPRLQGRRCCVFAHKVGNYQPARKTNLARSLWCRPFTLATNSGGSLDARCGGVRGALIIAWTSSGKNTRWVKPRITLPIAFDTYRLRSRVGLAEAIPPAVPAEIWTVQDVLAPFVNFDDGGAHRGARQRLENRAFASL